MTAIAPATRDAAVAAYLAGASLKDAGAQHGVSGTSVQRWVTAATKDNPRLLENRHPQCDGAPRVYRGGWTPRGGIQRPLVSIRTSTRPTRLDTQGDTPA